MFRGALREYEARIAGGTATWQDYHQAAVLLDQLELSARLWGWWGRRRHRTYIAMAKARYDQAIASSSPDPVALCAIRCDEMVNMLHHDHAAAVRTLESAYETLSLAIMTATTTEESLRARHQLAICAGFLARVEGYKSQWDKKAHLLFEEEMKMGPPDNGRAYRSFLLAMSLIDPMGPNFLATMALRSAKRYKERSQVVRAQMIVWFGRRGERMVRMLHHPFA